MPYLQKRQIHTSMSLWIKSLIQGQCDTQIKHFVQLLNNRPTTVVFVADLTE